MTDFSRFTEAIQRAFQTSLKQDEIVSKKQEILNGVYEYHNLVPSSTLFVGFNPAIFTKKNGKVTVTGITESVKEYLDSRGADYVYASEQEVFAQSQRFDAVVAGDEFFTFADSGPQQQELVKQVCNLAQEFVISTLRDYKNQDFKDREFSAPAVVRGNKSTMIWNEFHDWNQADRNLWTSHLHGIDLSNGIVVADSFKRHTMYFKQLAKFSSDAGADDFTVHKNLMYKSPIRKNYEHVISIRFER